MRAIWNGYISFGLITMPVAIGVAQQRRDVSFRTLCRESMTPVRQKRWDPVLDREVLPEETVKGYEVSKGSFIAVEDSELERFAARQEKTIAISRFVAVSEVDPVLFDRAYWIEPGDRAERPYALLLRAMERTGQAALGRFVLSTKEHLVLLRPHEGAMTMETLYYPDDVRLADHRAIAQAIAGVEVAEAELAMAEQLVRGLSGPLELDQLENATRRELIAYLEQRAAGETPEIEEAATEPAPVIDLMSALSASLAGLGQAGEGHEQAPAGDGQAAASA